MKPLRLLSAGEWSIRLTIGLDAIALIALWATRDVHDAAFIAALGLALASFVPWARLSVFTMTATMALAMAGTILAIVLFHVPAVVACAHAAPLTHALLWLSDRKKPLVPWRVGFGFVEVILASALTTELYLYFLLVVFVTLAALTVSCLFLAHEQESGGKPTDLLPNHYLRQTFIHSIVLVVSSLIIFPLLPRLDSGTGLHLSSTAQTGYSEQVQLNGWTAMTGQAQGGIALRIFSPDGADLDRMFFNGLIRGRVLDQFDGDAWTAAPRRAGLNLEARFQPHEAAKHPPAPRLAGQPVRIDIVREPIDSAILPIPYAARSVRLSGSEGSNLPSELKGEYVLVKAQNRRIQYSVEFLPALRFLASDTKKDFPSNVHSFVPPRLRTDRMEQLSRKIFANRTDVTEKVQAVLTYFRQQGFRALGDGETDLTDEATQQNRLHLIENFLFVRRAGHCELFASSLATLLRLGGVPARLVAGFRVSRSAVGSMLLVHSGDAHAWVEYFDPRLGWSVVDPTPRMPFEMGYFERLRVTYEVMSGYWYKYVLTYGEEGGTLLREAKEWTRTVRSNRFGDAGSWALPLACAVLLLALVAAVLASRGRAKRRRGGFNILLQHWNGPPQLNRVRKRAERALRRHARRGTSPSAEALNQYQALYPSARFGRPADDDFMHGQEKALQRAVGDLE